MDHMPYTRPAEVVLLQRSRYIPLAPGPASNEDDWSMRCELCGLTVTTTLLALFREAAARVGQPRTTCSHPRTYRREPNHRKPNRWGPQPLAIDAPERRALVLAEARYELVTEPPPRSARWHLRCLRCEAEVSLTPVSLRPRSTRTSCHHRTNTIIKPARDRLNRHPDLNP